MSLRNTNSSKRGPKTRSNSDNITSQNRDVILTSTPSVSDLRSFWEPLSSGKKRAPLRGEFSPGGKANPSFGTPGLVTPESFILTPSVTPARRHSFHQSSSSANHYQYESLSLQKHQKSAEYLGSTGQRKSFGYINSVRDSANQGCSGRYPSDGFHFDRVKDSCKRVIRGKSHSPTPPMINPRNKNDAPGPPSNNTRPQHKKENKNYYGIPQSTAVATDLHVPNGALVTFASSPNLRDAVGESIDGGTNGRDGTGARDATNSTPTVNDIAAHATEQFNLIDNRYDIVSDPQFPQYELPTRPHQQYPQSQQSDLDQRYQNRFRVDNRPERDPLHRQVEAQAQRQRDSEVERQREILRVDGREYNSRILHGEFPTGSPSTPPHMLDRQWIVPEVAPRATTGVIEDEPLRTPRRQNPHLAINISPPSARSATAVNVQNRLNFNPATDGTFIYDGGLTTPRYGSVPNSTTTPGMPAILQGHRGISSSEKSSSNQKSSTSGGSAQRSDLPGSTTTVAGPLVMPGLFASKPLVKVTEKNRLVCYDPDDLAGLGAFRHLSTSIFASPSVWRAMSLIVGVAITVGLLSFLTIPDPKQVSLSELVAVSNFLKVFIAFMLGLHVTASYNRFQGLLGEITNLFTAVKQISAELATLGGPTSSKTKKDDKVSKDETKTADAPASSTSPVPLRDSSRPVKLTPSAIAKMDKQRKLVQRYGILSCHLFYFELFETYELYPRRQENWRFYFNGLEDKGYILPSERQQLQKNLAKSACDSSSLCWLWIGSLITRMSQDGQIPGLTSPTYNCLMKLSKRDAVASIRSGKAALGIQMPFPYAHMLAVMVHVNNYLLALMCGLQMGVSFGTIYEEINTLTPFPMAQTSSSQARSFLQHVDTVQDRIHGENLVHGPDLTHDHTGFDPTKAGLMDRFSFILLSFYEKTMRPPWKAASESHLVPAITNIFSQIVVILLVPFFYQAFLQVSAWMCSPVNHTEFPLPLQSMIAKLEDEVRAQQKIIDKPPAWKAPAFRDAPTPPPSMPVTPASNTPRSVTPTLTPRNLSVPQNDSVPSLATAPSLTTAHVSLDRPSSDDFLGSLANPVSRDARLQSSRSPVVPPIQNMHQMQTATRPLLLTPPATPPMSPAPDERVYGSAGGMVGSDQLLQPRQSRDEIKRNNMTYFSLNNTSSAETLPVTQLLSGIPSVTQLGSGHYLLRANTGSSSSSQVPISATTNNANIGIDLQQANKPDIPNSSGAFAASGVYPHSGPTPRTQLSTTQGGQETSRSGVSSSMRQDSKASVDESYSYDERNAR